MNEEKPKGIDEVEAMLTFLSICNSVEIKRISESKNPRIEITPSKGNYAIFHDELLAHLVELGLTQRRNQRVELLHLRHAYSLVAGKFPNKLPHIPHVDTKPKVTF